MVDSIVMIYQRNIKEMCEERTLVYTHEDLVRALSTHKLIEKQQGIKINAKTPAHFGLEQSCSSV